MVCRSVPIPRAYAACRGPGCGMGTIIYVIRYQSIRISEVAKTN